MSESPQLAVDRLELDPRQIGPSGVRMVRMLLAVGGVASLLWGVLLLVVPARTIWFFALIIGIQIAVAGVLRLFLGIFGHWDTTGHRILSIFLGLLLVIAGIIILRDLNLAAVLLLRIAILFTGISWIVDGIGAIVESRSGAPKWGLFYGVISVIGGLIVLVVARWSIVWLIIYVAISLIVLGISGLVRAFTFGRGISHAGSEGRSEGPAPMRDADS